MRNRRAYLLVEVIIGLGLLGVLMTSLIVVIVRQNRLSDALAETRTCVAAAEDALIRLAGGALPDPPAETRITLARIDGAVLGQQRVWVEVTAWRGMRSVALTGLIPRQSWERWQKSGPATAPATVPVEGTP